MGHFCLCLTWRNVPYGTSESVLSKEYQWLSKNLREEKEAGPRHDLPITHIPADTLRIHEGLAPEGMRHKHKANLGKPVAASPLLVQAVVQKPLANGLSDFN